MSNILKGLKPEAVLSLFEEITHLPRCGGMERNVQEWVEKWAKRTAVEYKRDDTGNICLTVAPTPGQEKVVTLTLQAHQDMVCEKTPESSHDFSKDPLPIKVEGDIVTSMGTSLGADDGIGLAMAMSVLANPGPKHGKLEAIFTVDEEGGFTGVSNMKPSFFTGEYMINIDSEEEGVIIVNSAGGANVDYTFNKIDQSSEKGDALKLEISGLLGGHSGVDIDLPRFNASIILAKGLKELNKVLPIRIIEMGGGTRGNAIPREAQSVFMVPDGRSNEAIKIINKWGKSIDRIKEPNLMITATRVEQRNSFSESTSKAIINLISEFPQGVFSWSKEYANLVQTSNNLGTVKTENEKITIHVYSRSSNDEDFEKDLKKLRDLGEKYGAEISQSKGNAGWKASPDSPLLKLVEKCYAEVVGSNPKVTGIHGGLECGVFSQLKPGLQIVSIGPTIRFPHSPREYVEAPTVETLWKVIKKVVSALSEDA
jgi:dipeptidase D